jgi:hypothetical protein
MGIIVARTADDLIRYHAINRSTAACARSVVQHASQPWIRRGHHQGGLRQGSREALQGRLPVSHVAKIPDTFVVSP